MCAARSRSIYYCRNQAGYPSFVRPRGCAALAILIAFIPMTWSAKRLRTRYVRVVYQTTLFKKVRNYSPRPTSISTLPTMRSQYKPSVTRIKFIRRSTCANASVKHKPLFRWTTTCADKTRTWFAYILFVYKIAHILNALKEIKKFLFHTSLGTF